VKNVYKRIRPQKVTQEILVQIKTLIKNGKLQPGERLPPERTLCDVLGVGRSSVREALNMLQALGFLEIKNRKGVFVRSVSGPLAADPLRQILEEDRTKLIDLYELRKDIELASAYFAAKMRSDTDLANMRELLRRMKADAQNPRLMIRHDLAFHLAVAQAAGNFLRMHILKNIFDLTGDFIVVVADKFGREGRSSPAIEFHEGVFRAIEKKDQQAARARMDEHLSWVEQTWKELAQTTAQAKD